MARQKIAAGNWKMNKRLGEGLRLVQEIVTLTNPQDCTVILGTPSIHLAQAHELLPPGSAFSLAAQNCFYEQSGAYTGEISPDQIASTGAEYVIIGHSERRQYFKETNSVIRKKVRAALDEGLKVIFCCGETKKEREAGNHTETVLSQVRMGLFGLGKRQFKEVVIAYEPVWAIGTGLTASPAQAQEMHAAIRAAVAHKYGANYADNTSILYGGSVKPANANEIFGQPDVDGGLIGGASLKADAFLAIIKALEAAK